MVLLLLIGLLLLASAVVLVARAFLVARFRTTASLGSIGRYGFGSATIDLDPAPGLRGFLDDLASGAGDIILRRLRFGDEEALRKQLVSAGMYKVTPRTIKGYQLLVSAGLTVLWIWLVLVGHMSAGMAILGLLASVVVGWIAPLTYVRRRSEMRLERIDYDMPELIDLLVVVVEAGLSLTAALQLASNRMRGPLGEELRIAIQEQRMGLPLLQALENMGNRCSTPAMRSFVRAMVQGERLGISVGQILRSLALEMRKRRRAAAEEKAQKAPIKILFPLIFMIFPAMFLVLLGPAMFALFDALKG